MKKIDKVIEMMVQRGAERAVLYSDKPYNVWVEGRKIQGAILSAAQLHQILVEITPVSQQSQIAQGGTFYFCYQSPVGAFDVGAEIFLESIQISLAPSQAVEVFRLASTPPPLPVVAPIAPTNVNLPTQQPIYCQKCGTPNIQGATFCNKCANAFSYMIQSPNSYGYPPPVVAPQVPVNNVVNVTVQQKSSNGGWIAATMVLLFATPLSCIAIPILMLSLILVFSIAIALLPMTVGASITFIIWNNKAIPQDKKILIVGVVAGFTVLAQLTMFLVSSQNQQPNKPATSTTRTSNNL